jgi:hypothetical protein
MATAVPSRLSSMPVRQPEQNPESAPSLYSVVVTEKTNGMPVVCESPR